MAVVSRSHNSASASKRARYEIGGRGLHTNEDIKLSISVSSTREFGVHFSAVIAGEVYEAPALISRLSGTSRATALVLRSSKNRKIELKTVEHFLAAAMAYGWPALDVEIEGHESSLARDCLEMPILDGASLEWCRSLESMGALCVRAPKEYSRIVKPFEYARDRKRVVFEPLDEMGVCEFIYDVSFGSTWRQRAEFVFRWDKPEASFEAFKSQIACARTFGFRHEIEELQRRGLAMGGSLQNALLLDHDKVVNPEGFCLPNELAAHKVLDAIGDFSLLGQPILGRVTLREAGHEMHLRALSEASKSDVFQNIHWAS